MECTQFILEITNYIKTGDLHPVVSATMRDHVRTCADCRMWWATAAHLREVHDHNERYDNLDKAA
jgi:hypothetical protein